MDENCVDIFPITPMKQKRLIGRTGNIFFITLSVVFCALGLLLYHKFNSLYDFIIEDAMKFNPESEAFKAWRTNNPPLVLDIYLFNWTNPEGLKKPGYKPHFQEVGPYRFSEVKDKINLTWHENNTISFKYVKRYYFMEDESPGKLDEKVTTINMVPLTAAFRYRFGPMGVQALSFIIQVWSKLYVTKTAGELLFNGYEDRFLSKVKYVTGAQDKFGWFYQRNNTPHEGTFSMYTKNDENFGKLLTWNHRNRTDYFPGKCGEIRGSAGEFHPMNAKPSDQVTVYSSEMCTFQDLQFEKNETVKEVGVYKFIPNNIFDNGSRIPEHSCYCNGECLPSGVLNISSCRQNAPVFLSLPHFLGADPYYINSIDGMQPDKDKHEFYISLEPKSSIVVDCGARMQLNVLLQPNKYFSMYRNVPKFMIPVFYFDQIVRVDDDLASKIKLLQDLPDISWKAALIFQFIGFVLITGVVILNYSFWKIFSINELKTKYFIEKPGKQTKTAEIIEDTPTATKL